MIKLLSRLLMNKSGNMLFSEIEKHFSNAKIDFELECDFNLNDINYDAYFSYNDENFHMSGAFRDGSYEINKI